MDEKKYLIKNDEKLPKEIFELEKEDMVKSKNIFYIKNWKENVFYPTIFLYHGIRFDSELKKLENILKTRKILAGKYLNNYYQYDDNANKGEYVSLACYSEDIYSGYDVFVRENISLLISPKCEAILTKFVQFDIWEKIKDKKTKNLYSYMEGEFMCKEFVDFEFVKAIGIPYEYYVKEKGKQYADDTLKKVKQLLIKYDINLDIVDTSSYNKILLKKRPIKNI